MTRGKDEEEEEEKRLGGINERKHQETKSGMSSTQDFAFALVVSRHSFFPSFEVFFRSYLVHLFLCSSVFFGF